MANNEAVVFLGPGKVEVQSIDYPKFQNPSGKPIEHGVILKIVSQISAVPINTWFVAAPPLPSAWCSVTRSPVKSSRSERTSNISRSVTLFPFPSTSRVDAAAPAARETQEFA